MCGSPTMDLSELQKVVVYDGYKPNEVTIQCFWEVTTTIKCYIRTCRVHLYVIEGIAQGKVIQETGHLEVKKNGLMI